MEYGILALSMTHANKVINTNSGHKLAGFGGGLQTVAKNEENVAVSTHGFLGAKTRIYDLSKAEDVAAAIINGVYCKLPQITKRIVGVTHADSAKHRYNFTTVMANVLRIGNAEINNRLMSYFNGEYRLGITKISSKVAKSVEAALLVYGTKSF